MTDATEQPADGPEPISRDWRTGIAVAVLVLCSVTINWVVVWGTSGNSLHASAMAWSYTLVAAILAGLGVSGIAPQIVQSLTQAR